MDPVSLLAGALPPKVQAALVILFVVLWGVSEALSLTKRTKANGVIQAIRNGMVRLFGSRVPALEKLDEQLPKDDDKTAAGGGK